MFRSVAVVLWLVKATLVASTAIDNGVEEIRVDCTDTGIGVRIGLIKPMITGGRLFVKGRSFESGCYAPMIGDSKSQAFGVTFGQCGMERTGVTGDTGDVSYMITMIASMHPIFITKVDRAYSVLCTYAKKTQDNIVTQMVDVSMLPTTEVTREYPRVACKYTIHLTAPDGPVVRYATVGQPLFHVWECQGLTDPQYIIIRNCYSRDAAGQLSVETIDSEGCARDPVAVMNPTYEPARIVAMSHAYKFPDQTFVAFECQISICDNCGITVPPTCPLLPPGGISTGEGGRPGIGLQPMELGGVGPVLRPGSVIGALNDSLTGGGERNETLVSYGEMTNVNEGEQGSVVSEAKRSELPGIGGLEPLKVETGIGQSEKGVGQSENGVGQSETGVGQSENWVGQSPKVETGVGQSENGVGQSENGSSPLRWPTQAVTQTATLPGPRRAKREAKTVTFDVASNVDVLDELEEDPTTRLLRTNQNGVLTENVCMGSATIALLATAVGIVCVGAVAAAWFFTRRPKAF